MMPQPERTTSPLDRPLVITFFPDFAAQEKREETLSLRAVAPRIQNTTGPSKAVLPWLKLAKFGARRTAKNSLRNNDNLLAISGVEGDYDHELTSVDEAVAILRAARIAAMVYTSPSHTEDTPRWRVLCPLSVDHAPEARTALLERVNGLFHGSLSGESFALSQSYYFGCVNRSPSHRVELIDGDYLDERADLDEGAIGKPKPAPAVPFTPPTRERNNSPFIEAVVKNALGKVRGAGEGQKHHTLRAQARLLGGYQHAGHYSEAEAVQWLMEALPDTAKDKAAAQVTAEWGFQKGAAQPIPIEERNVVYLRPQEPPPEIDDPGYLAALEADITPDEPTDEAIPRKPATAPKPGIPITWFTDLRADLASADLVEDLLGQGAMSVLYGESNSGKTFFATNLALHIACGWEWFGRHVERMGVIYCALEGARGIKNRVEAFKIEHGLGGEDIPFGIVTVPLDMCADDSDAAALIDAIKAEAERLGIAVGLIVMDTLSRAMAGGNENGPDDMGALVSHGDKIRNELKAHLLWVHHSGKDQAKGARGHSLLRAATDTEIEVSAEGGARCAKVTKQREYECSGEFAFGLKVIELGKNARGKAITSCVVENFGEGANAGASLHRRRLPKQQQRALEVLADLVGSAGQSGHPGTPADVPSVPEKWWRERFYERAMPGAEPGAKKMAFRRASDALLTAHLIGMSATRVWVVYGAKTQSDTKD